MTLITEHELSVQHDYKFPIVQVYNVKPQGMLRNIPTNETLVHFEKLVIDVTGCLECSAEEKIDLERN